MAVPREFDFSITTLIVISILCFIIAGYLIVKYLKQEPRTPDTLYFISAMIVFGVRFIFQTLWYIIPDPVLNKIVNAITVICIIIAAFLITTFFFSIYFKETPQRFKIVLGLTTASVIVFCALLIIFIDSQVIYQEEIMAPILGEYRYDYGELIVLISFVYLVPASFINFGLFLYISLKKYDGRLRLKSVLMASGLIAWVIAELLGPYTWFYIMNVGALFVILVGFLLPKE